MNPDPETMDRFLSHLFGNELRGLVELAWRDPGDGKLRHAQLFRLDDLDALIAKAVEVFRCVRASGQPDLRPVHPTA